jgi:C_GCAxxG_C_C family probable redox protein
MEKNMKARFEKAKEKFEQGYNCSQSVLLSFDDLTRIDEVTAINISRGFGAGMGRREEVCGAVTGGTIALGLCIGASDKDENAKRDVTYLKVNNLMDEFAGKFNTYNCRELLGGCDLNTEEGSIKFKEKEMRKNICLNCVAESAKIVEKLIVNSLAMGEAHENT